VARPIIGLEEFIRVHLIILIHHKLANPLGRSHPFVCFGFLDFMRTFLVSRFPFGSVYFLLLTGLILKFIVADLFPVFKKKIP